MPIPTDFDVIYLSYDEPNAEKNWAQIKSVIPWAKRVHGIKGFDNAHKECAKNSSTDYFITIDGDNVVDKKFLSDIHHIDLNKIKNSVVSFSGKNFINGLIYGNGGIKIWPKNLVLNMKTHENTDNDGKGEIDFCWKINYIQMNNCYSIVYPNETPFQAFRAGFREGIKMSLEQGKKVDPNNLSNELHGKNYQRLLIWCTIGADVKNGLWAIYGARLGCYMNYIVDWNETNVRDYDWLNHFWENKVMPYFINDNGKFSRKKLKERIQDLGDDLRFRLNMNISEFDETQSKFFKSVYTNPLRTNIMITEDMIDDYYKNLER